RLLASELGLGRLATDILLVVAAPALWGEIARAYGIVAGDPDRPLCDELLVAQLLGGRRASRREIRAELAEGAPLVRHELIQVGAGRPPFAELSPHPLVVRRLFGETFAGAE